jgi:hypothetical protein
MPDRDVLSLRPRVVLICHAESRLNREGIARWLASFGDLVGIVLIEETSAPARVRIRREIKRVGLLRFVDVLAFRAYYVATLSRRDRRWLEARLDQLAARWPAVPESVPVLRTPDPNSDESAAFLQRVAPEIVLARCKRILKARIFEIPATGTFILHPGVCPEYRNAHGAFWALAQGDLDKVGLTLLKIDKGVDTGPVYGYFQCDYDEIRESHIVIMSRLALDNLDAIRERLLAIHHGAAHPIDTAGRRSAVWGQPWLTSYLRWKREATRRRHARIVARVS